MRGTRPQPFWVIVRDVDLLRREIRIAQAAGDPPAMQLAARLFLNGGPARAEEVLTFARELPVRGVRDDAMLLTRVAQEKFPSDGDAAELWETLRKVP